MMPHIIEFVGVPCCGKSTLSHKVVNQLSANKRINEKQFELSHNVNIIKRSWAKLFRAVNYCARNPVRAFKIRNIFPSIGRRINYYYIMDLCSCKETVVLEQGFCQIVMSLFEKEKPYEKRIEEILNQMPLGEQDMVVFIDVTQDEIKDRMKKRPQNDQPYFSNADDVDAEIEKSIMTLQIIKRVIEKKKIRSIVVENHSGEDNIAAQSIVAALEELEDK